MRFLRNIHMRRIAVSFSAIILLFTFLSVSFPSIVLAQDIEPGTYASHITEGYSITLADGQASGVLIDSNYNTYLQLTGGEIQIQSDMPIAHLYVIWDKPPGSYTITAGGVSTSAGVGGFIHEFVSLEAPASEVALQLEEGAYTLCDIYLYTEGTPPPDVQQWQPPLEDAELLLLPTHADDEHLFFGGIMPTYAGEREMAVQVAYLTNHWNQDRRRPHELLFGLWTVGIKAYPVIDSPFEDLYSSKENLEAAEATFGHENMLAYQVELLRRFKPEVVVGHDLNGEYGHGAHVLNAVTLTEAILLSGDSNQFPESAAQYGVWDVSKAYLHLYGEHQIVLDWTIPLDNMGGATGIDLAAEAFAQHYSQQGQGFKVTLSPTRDWEDCTKFGLYYTAVGPDIVGDDLFENIDLTPEPEPEPESEIESESPVSSSAPDIDSSLSVPNEEPIGEVTPVWLVWGGIGLAVLLIIILVIVLVTSRRRRR